MAAEEMMAQYQYTYYRRRSGSHVWVWNFLIALLVGAIWSFWPTLCAGYAALTLKGVDVEIVAKGNDLVQLELQRTVQKHFLDYGIYLPLEDIIFTRRLLEANKDLEPGLKKACGEGLFAVWLPVVVKIPLLGERSTEWCWKPTLKK